MMELNLRADARYAIACPTSMGVRITPDNRLAVHHSNHFYMQATSAETNVLSITSSLGRECLALTKFVKGNPIAQFIKNDLRARNIAYEGVEVDQGGPWGFRHQFNIADSGFGLRPPGCGTTGRERWAAPCPSASSIWSVFSAGRAWAFCTCPA